MNSSFAMKICVLVLLGALLCTERAQGLRCYQCMAVLPGASCPEADCPFNNGVCIFQEVKATIDSYTEIRYNKFCLSSCDQNQSLNQSFELLGATVQSKMSCCKEDLCNAAVSARGSAWSLAGMLGLSLGLILQQVLL